MDEREVIKDIRKTYRESSIYLLKQFPVSDAKSVPTGSLFLDAAIGVGGIPRGRYTQVYGPDGSGKTTLCQHIIAEAQRSGLTCAYIDVEQALDLPYAIACGIDFDTAYLSQPDFEEEALGIAEMLVKSGEIQVIVIDSIAALSPEMESQNEFGDKMTTGMIRAKLLNVFFRRCTRYVKANDVAVIFTTQLRANTKSKWGGTKPVGGWGIKHYASVRIALNQRYQGEIKAGGDFVGQEIEFNIVKNRVAAPFKTGVFIIMFGTGIDRAANVLEVAESFGLLQKRGAFYRHGDEILGQGKAKAIQALKDNPELLDTLEEKCKEIIENGE